MLCFAPDHIDRSVWHLQDLGKAADAVPRLVNHVRTDDILQEIFAFFQRRILPVDEHSLPLQARRFLHRADFFQTGD